MATNPFHYSPDNDPTIIATGGAPAGSAPVNNPVLVAGQDGGPLVRVLLTDTSGRSQVNVNFSGVAASVNAGAADTGTLRIISASNDPVVTQLSFGASAIAKREDDASANADVGVPAMAIQQSTPADTAGTNGDYAMLQMSAGRLWTTANLQIAGTAVDGNSGNKSAQTLRVVLATDQPALTNSLLVAGTKTPADAVTTPTDAQNVESFGLAFNNSTSDRVRNNSAANMARAVQPDALSVIEPAQWAVAAAPGGAGNTQATASKAAGGAAVRHVARNATFVFEGFGAVVNGASDAVIRDGATGAGTIIFRESLGIPNTTSVGIDRAVHPGLNIMGSLNTAMTIEFNAAGGANTFETVTLLGISVQ